MNPLYLTFAFALTGYSGVTAARLLLSLYALELGAEPAQLGILFASFFIFPLLLSWPVGLWADRMGSRGLLLLGLATGTGGMLIPYFIPRLFALYAGAVMVGLAFVFLSVLAQNLVGLLSKPEERARNFANSSMTGSASNIVGPLIAGFAIDHAGHAIASLCSAALFLAALLIVVLWGGVLPGGRGRQAVAAQGTLRERLSDKTVLGIIAITCLVQIGQDLYQLYLPIYGHSIGISASAIGAILAAFFTASTTLRVFLPQLVKKLGQERLLAYSFFVCASGFALLPMFESPVMLGVISFCFGLGLGCGMPITMMLLFSRAPEGRSGETVGLRQAVNNLARVVTPTLFGFIASAAGLLVVFGLSAALMGMGSFFTYRQSIQSTQRRPDDK